MQGHVFRQQLAHGISPYCKIQKRSSVCSEHISKMGLLVGFKLRLARSNCFG